MSLFSLFAPAKRHKTPEGKLCIVLERAGVDLFLDVGANIGQTGLALRRGGYSGRILSFEPLAACRERLLEASADDPGWEVMARCALGDVDGEVDIMVAEADDMSSLAAPTKELMAALPRSDTVATERVPIARLDTLFGDGFDAERPFLKIDAQGHDLAVLKGAQGVMELIEGIQIEMSLLPLYEGEPTYLEIVNYIHGLGFDAHQLTERTFSRALGRQLQVDGVFLRER